MRSGRGAGSGHKPCELGVKWQPLMLRVSWVLPGSMLKAVTVRAELTMPGLELKQPLP
ncbi:MAG: hypothetical protein ACYTFN_19140 [Planctomycetota bacterium]